MVLLVGLQSSPAKNSILIVIVPVFVVSNCLTVTVQVRCRGGAAVRGVSLVQCLGLE